METISYRLAGHTAYEYRLTVPLDHFGPTPGELEVFAREIVRSGNESKPRLLWLQGGPGHGGDRPATISGWIDRALEDYRVVLLDQRGTAHSTPVEAQTLAGMTASQQADYLAFFRADSIIADAEALREALGGHKWSALGQSYGGFLATAYLSQAPNSLREVLITAGLPALAGPADHVYEATFAQTERRNHEYARVYPDDAAKICAIAAHLRGTEEFLPTGERLTPERFLQVGIGLGSERGFTELHYLFEDPFVVINGTKRLRARFLRAVGAHVSFAARPLYALMHETIYAQGAATNWAAQRVRDQLPQFDPAASKPLLTGEHIFPFQFEQDPALVPLAEAAHLLAKRADFPALYNREVLAHNEVPAAAAIYFDDMFVPRELSLQTAAAINGLRPLITNEYQHDGIRVDGYRLLDRLIKLVRS